MHNTVTQPSWGSLGGTSAHPERRAHAETKITYVMFLTLLALYLDRFGDRNRCVLSCAYAFPIPAATHSAWLVSALIQGFQMFSRMT
jgi:hypothetical protein